MKDEKKFWDRQVKRFDKSSSRETYELIERSTPYLQDKNRLLDVGCATGQSSLWLRNYVPKVLGIDYSPEMIRVAKERLNESGVSDVDFLAADVYDLGEDGSFDIIVAFNVLHLLKEPKKALEKIRELLEDDGIFISYTPCIGDGTKSVRFLSKTIGYLGNLPKATLFRGETLKQMMVESGFDLIESETGDDMAQSTYMVAVKNNV